MNGQGPGFQTEPLPYSEFEPAIGMQHSFGISMHFPTMGGGYCRPLRYEEGGPVSPYLPQQKKIVLSPVRLIFAGSMASSFLILPATK
jgi:hypothetical protein